MNPFQLTFKFEEAYKYQKCLVQQLIEAHTEVLQKLTTMKKERMDMRTLVGESPETWDAMVQIIKPTSQITDSGKKISLQEKILTFLNLKLSALDAMIAGNKQPQVRLIYSLSTVLIILLSSTGQKFISRK